MKLKLLGNFGACHDFEAKDSNQKEATTMDTKKYEFTNETVQFHDKTLHRIRALRDLGSDVSVVKGTLGGFIESEDNLSHDGNCWVCYGVWISGSVVVSDNAEISGDVNVVGPITFSGNAKVW